MAPVIRIGLFFLLIAVPLSSCDDQSNEVGGEEVSLVFFRLGSVNAKSFEGDTIPEFSRISMTFNCSLSDPNDNSNFTLLQDSREIDYQITAVDEGKTIFLDLSEELVQGQNYTFTISSPLPTTCGDFPGLTEQFTVALSPLEMEQIFIDDTSYLMVGSRLTGAKTGRTFTVAFNDGVESSQLGRNMRIIGEGSELDFGVSNISEDSLSINLRNDLEGFSRYRVTISSDLISTGGRAFPGADFLLYTNGDDTDKFPRITTEELLTLIQRQTFRYFWDFAHPVSGLIRERNTSGNLVTIGGSGFGVMAILVGIERDFITRDQGVQRLTKIVDFLTQADRFHGVWPHWMDGTTGETIPFSQFDDGADLVETAFMIQGLLAARQFLDDTDATEGSLIRKINTIWRQVEWNWFTKGGENVLYWHWSPNYGWEMNLPIRGWNESLIIYVLAASSPTFPIDQQVYETGWARNGGIENQNNNRYYGYTLPLRSDRGGPLFFAHYSFLGLDPNGLSDQYANYFEQNRIHTSINRAYCIANPERFVGYGENAWGLTASDGNAGYSAHSPDNDRGVITPTAAISSIPYTPEKSIEVLEHFYYKMGHKLWGPYGFYDAFNLTENWFASSYLAIDQGPIICMIENYRSGLLWNHFMTAPEVRSGLNKLEFTYE